MSRANNQFTFIDLFAGCGGLSLGLLNAGWKGLFAIEREDRAFATLHHNLVAGKKPRFDWPAWLPQAPLALESLLLSPKYLDQLRGLRERVDLLAGGPPCQGFSTLGRRLSNDPRNQM